MSGGGKGGLAGYIKVVNPARRYFVSFVHKLLPRGTKEFGNVVVTLASNEVFSIRKIEETIQDTSGLNDVTILNFQLLTNGEN